MKNNFNEIVDRKSTESVKWNGVKSLYGRDDVIPMWVADMDFKSPPEVIEALKQRAEHGIFGYPMLDEDYFVPFINWIKARHGIEIKKEWIVTTDGVVDALKIAILAYSKPGDNVVIQTPVYYPFYNIIKSNGRMIIKNSLKFENRNYSMDFDDLEKKLSLKRTKLFILCNPHNPVGRVWKREELEKLVQLCIKHNVLLLSDEIHSDLVFSPNKHIPIFSISQDIKEGSLTFYAPSKTFNLAGLKASFAVIPNEQLRTEYKNVIESLSSDNLNIFGMVAAKVAYERGEDWLDDLLNYLRANIDYVYDFFNEKLPKVKLQKPEGTYLMWLDFRAYGDEQKVKDILVNKAKVGLEEGSIFGEEGKGFFRMNIGCPISMLKDACNNIYDAFKNL
ncbi:aminotransferase class I and II [Petrotoga mobilis SJ95]|uniref:cysteine-S-conjugate beta-lyase n=1 Tax=Petrotoga mobilis (strain DSM 10674 / SJ95) TaxID=403833 RepID=A9BIW0_PETMO|nr:MULTISPECIES: MalY/PatB family protein [Petrotoga]ABX32448.1 aminotransferase class I and II [Petrotoga mobilis SJ95]MBL5981533.1 cystathionine beta-lyase [Petrotoga sp. 8T1HF07.NaAc.6.1]PNR91463.1 cystathionine beta-lyase [Petrotoga sp. HWHPT.55.6.3]RPD35221.1 cystathionine beta-lyase [Petrotoga sp. HWH.PT.55.6.1]